MSSVLLTAHLVKTLRHPWVPIGLTSLQPETLCCFLFLICYLQTKTSFFFFYSLFTPQIPHEPFQAHPILSPTLFSFQNV